MRSLRKKSYFGHLTKINNLDIATAVSMLWLCLKGGFV